MKLIRIYIAVFCLCFFKQNLTSAIKLGDFKRVLDFSDPSKFKNYH